jgi:hypothetical protein
MSLRIRANLFCLLAVVFFFVTPIMPVQNSESDETSSYNAFTERQAKTAEFLIEQIRKGVLLSIQLEQEVSNNQFKNSDMLLQAGGDPQKNDLRFIIRIFFRNSQDKVMWIFKKEKYWRECPPRESEKVENFIKKAISRVLTITRKKENQEIEI